MKRSGGCITFTNLKHHRKVKALGTYLNWTKVPLGDEEVHLLTSTWNMDMRHSLARRLTQLSA